MRVLLMSTLFALGLGLVATAGASASTFSAGANEASKANSLIEQVQYRRCRSVRICRHGPFGRRCHWERVCRF
jgi:hypothetical protein